MGSLSDKVMAAVHGGKTAPLSTYELFAIAANASAGMTVHAMRRSPGAAGVLLGKRETNPVTATVLTTATRLLAADAQRTSYTVINHGQNPVTVFFDGQVAATRGIKLQSDGGWMIVEGDSILIGGPASARADPNDRNASQQSNEGFFNPGAAVRASTNDWTYTVPAGRKARLEASIAKCWNDSVTVTNALARVDVDYTPSGGSPRSLLLTMLPTGAASREEGEAVGYAMTMGAADRLRGFSRSDNNAAGSNVFVHSAFKSTEYDA